ncbi:MAG: SDR family NAD(P)-dependent oxidoreductase [Myxococcota bacterium]|nr:SDR family NAD(P)-dependent oxidoreductase [Myxococcota bacterium]
MSQGKHVVVTGASSGIGMGIARAFDRPGYRVSLVARREELLRELQGELKTESEVVVADLNDPEDPTRWLREAEAALGPTDILVNNAGMSYVEPTPGISAERIARIFQLNLMTPIAAMHHVMEHMLERGEGTIVNVASNIAFQPAPYFNHYAATKGGLANFSEALRMELKGTGVHVVTVYPGPVQTPMGDHNWGLVGSPVLRMLSPYGNTRALARLVLRAVEKRRARLIYPRFYALGWFLPSIGRFVAEFALPEITGPDESEQSGAAPDAPAGAPQPGPPDESG